jgi:hypothetical protein
MNAPAHLSFQAFFMKWGGHRCWRVGLLEDDSCERRRRKTDGNRRRGRVTPPWVTFDW